MNTKKSAQKPVKLTTTQKKLLDKIKEEWVSYSRSTKPANRKMAEKAVCDIYRNAGKEPPKEFYWVESPRAGYIASGMLGKTGTGKPKVDVQRALKDSHFPWFYGSLDSAYAIHDVFYRIGTVDEKKREKWVVAFRKLAQSCGWVWVYRNEAILSERPSVINFDKDNRLHCENGPALEYKDGFKIYAVHGIRAKDLDEVHALMAKREEVAFMVQHAVKDGTR